MVNKYFMMVYNVAANVHAFVLLGASSIRRPRRRQLNVVTKDKILFYCSIVNIKLGQKAEQRSKS
jgi:hypothetical protein